MGCTLDQDGSLWAPDIHYRDGKYHLYYSVSAWMNFNSSIGYASNTTLDRNKPGYKWVDHGQVISYKNGGEGVNVIDPNIFTDKDGKVWLVYRSYKAGLRMVELDPKTGKLKSETPQLVTLTTSLGEGVFIIKDRDYYYIIASRGKCCAGMESTYQMVTGRSKTVTGHILTRKVKAGWKISIPFFLQEIVPHRVKGTTVFLRNMIQPSSYIMHTPVQPGVHLYLILNLCL